MIGRVAIAGMSSHQPSVRADRGPPRHHARDLHGHHHGEMQTRLPESKDTADGRNSPGHGAGKTPPRKDHTTSQTGKDLDPDAQREVERLEARDREVRAHEAVHKAAAGKYGGAVSFEWAVGPDGRRYAVGGDVSIDASVIPDDPEATIRKMEIIARAALAPAQPSAHDRTVATQARQSAAKARRQLTSEQLAAMMEKAGKPASLQRMGTGVSPIELTGNALNIVV